MDMDNGRWTWTMDVAIVGEWMMEAVPEGLCLAGLNTRIEQLERASRSSRPFSAYSEIWAGHCWAVQP
jgi:hypothetical protein